MILSFSGHRPDKLGGWNIPNPIYNHVCQNIEFALKELQPEKTISGMALGTDLYGANISFKLKIPFIAAVPFIGQESVWNENQKKIYRSILKKAAEVVIVSEGGYSASKMQTRNQWMCDKADIVLAIFDGSNGGTGNCVTYAKSVKKSVIIIDPNPKTFSKENLIKQINDFKNS
jgi:uncharacterized phage-like protein YoqJ